MVIHRTIKRWFPFLLLQLIVFSLSVIYGVMTPSNQAPCLQQLNTFDIFYNNLMLGYNLVVYGCFTASIIPIILFACNGIHIGTVASVVYKIYGIEGIIKGIVPHSLPELFGIFCFGCISLYPGYLLICFLRRKRMDNTNIFVDTIFLAIAGVMLLFIGAFIEGNFSRI